MARWVGLPTSEDAASTDSAVADTRRSESIDRDALLKQLQVGGRLRPALVAKVIGLFLADMPVILDELTRGLERKDPRAIERAVHTIKSSATSVGAFALSDVAGLAEGHARSGSLDAVQAHVGEIRRQFDAAVVQLEILRAELLLPQPEVVES